MITTRRQFLRAAGVSLALPLLESTGAFGAAAPAIPRRLLAVCFGLGLHGPNVIPKSPGRDYALTPYLEALGDGARNHLTVVSGTSHPEVTLGHASDACFLTSARGPGAPSFRNTISLDQLLVEKLKPDTRFPSLVLSTRGGSISFTRAGVQIPSDGRPSSVFARLFVNGSPAQVAEQMKKLADGQSVMDTVLGPAKTLQAKVSAPDRERLDQYFAAVRDVEQRLVSGQEWAKKPKPKVDYRAPKDIADPRDDVGRLKLMLDLVYLAFQTDSTRFVTLYVNGSNAVQPIPGVTQEYHSLSHHGQDPEKLTQLKIVESQQMGAIGGLLGKLRGVKEGGETLLDRSAVMCGSAMGNASSHNCKNLPIVLAGGGFKHGQHLAFDPVNNTPLCKLYVSLLQRFGVAVDAFGTGKGTLTGLEHAG
jgi:Protein of unknown function (DUF1552)